MSFVWSGTKVESTDATTESIGWMRRKSNPQPKLDADNDALGVADSTSEVFG